MNQKFEPKWYHYLFIVVAALAIALPLAAFIFGVPASAYTADFGTRYTDLYTLPYNLGFRDTATNRWFNIANTPFGANSITEDTEFNLRFDSSNLGALVSSSSTEYYVEPYHINDYGYAFNRAILYYYNFRRTDTASHVLSTITCYSSNISNIRYQLKFDAIGYDIDGNVYSKPFTKSYSSFDSSGKTSVFLLNTDMFPAIDIATGSSFFAYTNVNITILNAMDINALQIVGDTAKTSGISFNDIYPASSSVELVTPDIFAWLRESVDGFLNQPFFGERLTLGGIVSIMLSLPLVVWFLRLIAGG